MKKVLGIGNALVDVLIFLADDNLLSILGLDKGSMQLIDQDKLQKIKKQIASHQKYIVSGGSAANTIIGLAKLGIPTGFIGQIGDDKIGTYFKKDLLSNAISDHLKTVPQASGVATTFISNDGERTFATYLGAAALLDPREIDQNLFTEFDYVYIEGYLVQSHELILKILELARKAHAKIILDLSSYNIVAQNKDFLQSIIPSINILFANEEEAKALVDKNPSHAVTFLAKQVDIAIVKNASKGSWIQQGSDKIFVDAHKVNCLDSTGAGDLYAAGFIYGLLNNYSLAISGEIGTLLAADVIQKVGAKINEANWNNLAEKIAQIGLST